jgi:hypothetical protein
LGKARCGTRAPFSEPTAILLLDIRVVHQTNTTRCHGD